MATTNAVLEVKDLSTHFLVDGRAAKAVDQVSMTVPRGEIVGLVGESGSGKSMTGLSILGLVSEPGKIVGGEILLNGQNLLDLSPAEMRKVRGNRISMIFQDPMMTLNPVLRIETQMVETIFAHHPDCKRREARERARDMLGRMGIASPDERLDAYPHQLSGGMCQRVAIATALLNGPELVVADEPTTALDVTIQSQILYEFQEMCRSLKTSVIWITHDLGVISGLADHLYVMYAGKIVEGGPVNEVLTDPHHPYTRGLLNSMPGEGSMVPIPGSAPSILSLPTGCTYHPRCSRRDDSLCLRHYPDGRMFADGRVARCHYPLEGANA